MNVAAFFDIDGTLVPPPSLEKRFLRYLRWRREIGWTNVARCAAPILRQTLRGIFSRDCRDFECAAAQCKAYLAGVPTTAMDTWLNWLARHPVVLIPGALRRIEWHARQGHRIFLLSGTVQPLASALARLIPEPVEVCATELESEGGRFTGRVRGDAVCGPAKARAMERLAAEFSLDLAGSYAYGDSFADRWMLARVGHPAVVQIAANCSWRLARFARRCGWPVLRWNAANQEERKFQYGGAKTAEGRRKTATITGAEANSR